MAITPDLENRLAQLKRKVPTRGFERHPLVLKSVSDLPAELQSPAVTTLAARETLQTIIAFPPQVQRGWDYVPKQASLFTPTDVIHLLASIWPDEEPQVTCVNGSGLMYMKITLLLLYGFLEIVAQGQTSQHDSTWSSIRWPGTSYPDPCDSCFRQPKRRPVYRRTRSLIPRILIKPLRNYR